ncbi:MAG: hypothetical protein K2I92_05910, partial [Muribaculaceae bacterium]|nr:hypothetical protein [Muribaculaceae bacterium]
MNQKLPLKALCASLLLCAPVAGAFARHLSPEEALVRAQSNSVLKHIPGNARFSLAYEEEQ